jgi:glutamate N-acetyltransferase/amino-acid N-acetyltransferase
VFSIFPIKGGIENIKGFYSDGLSIGLKPNGAKDLGFIYSKELFDVEAIFTSNRFQAAPLKHYQEYEDGFKTNFLLVNSKNANAMTGDDGISDIKSIFSSLNYEVTNPIMSSTGVIGVRLDRDKIVSGANSFNLEAQNSDNFQESIMTTDAYPKRCSYEVLLEDGKSFKISAFAKGAGMINPTMATMLCFIVTDADVPKLDMKEVLRVNTTTTFNAISVDGDTSTNDTVMLLSNGKSGAYDKEAFFEAIRLVMHDIAIMIVSDGEGAKKHVAFEVTGAKNTYEAEIVAKKLSNSLLVKTALFGEDPNFGRIASTVGASEVECDETKLVIQYNDVTVFDKGKILFSKDIEAKASEVLKQESFRIKCHLGVGEGEFVAYGCDLGHEYVTINADYRT